MPLADLVGGPDPLVGPRRRHPNVGDHDVGLLGRGGLEEAVVVGADGDDVEVRLGVDELAHALANQVVVLGQYHPYAHGQKG